MILFFQVIAYQHLAFISSTIYNTLMYTRTRSFTSNFFSLKQLVHAQSNYLVLLAVFWFFVDLADSVPLAFHSTEVCTYP